MTQRFEHNYFTTSRLDNEDFDTLMQTYSEQGWELVTVILTSTQKYMLFWKRPAAKVSS